MHEQVVIDGEQRDNTFAVSPGSASARNSTAFFAC